MNIVAITITLNDDFKFDEWFNHYLEYKDELYKHIIVDNGSTPKYLELVKNKFSDSIIIERHSNGGCTIAYNDALKLALADQKVDAIMLIGNDIRLPKGNLTNLYQYLYSDDQLGMVAPVLFAKDSDIVESYGNDLTFFNRMRSKCGKSCSLSQIKDHIYVDAVPGGMNLSKREFYERVGLQDNALFMYCDEHDMAKRSQKMGFKMGVTKSVYSWHQHINPNNGAKRPNYASYLSARNHIYLTKKHDGVFKTIIIVIHYFLLMTFHLMKNIRNKEGMNYYKISYKGIWNGLVNNMDNSFLCK